MSDASRRPSADQVVVPARRGEKSERFQATPDEDVVPGGGCWVKSDQSWRKVDFSHLRRRAVSPRSGENSGSAKLKDADIPVILSLYNSGLSGEEVAKRYGVSVRTIFCIIHNKTWQHVPREDISNRSTSNKRRVGVMCGSSKLDDHAVLSIRKSYASGKSSASLATQFGVSQSCICAIISGKTWGHVAKYGEKISARNPGKPAKLNKKSVIDIRKRFIGGETQTSIAASYDVDRSVVWSVVNRKTWKHVP